MYRSLISALFALAIVTPSYAQHNGHDENHDWYQHLKQPGTGYGCCSNNDCRPTKAYWDDVDEVWMAVNPFTQNWIRVPDKYILADKENKDPMQRPHICVNPHSGLIYCFLRGQPKS